MRKRRTRSHVIADLSANHVEKQVLLCGYTVERIVHDYGVDLLLFTYSPEGEVENETVKLQLKATDRLPVRQEGEKIAYLIARSDLEYWLGEWQPVILIVYDAQDDIAYWLYIQAEFENRAASERFPLGETITVHLERGNVITTEAIRLFARYKADILRQRPEVIRHVL